MTQLISKISVSLCILLHMWYASYVVSFMYPSTLTSSSYNGSIKSHEFHRRMKVYQSSANTNTNTNRNPNQQNQNQNRSTKPFNRDQSQGQGRPGQGTTNNNNNNRGNGNTNFNRNNNNNNRPFNNNNNNNNSNNYNRNNNNQNNNNFPNRNNNQNQNNNNFPNRNNNQNQNNNNNNFNRNNNFQGGGKPAPFLNANPAANPRMFNRNPKAVEEEVPLMNEQIRVQQVRVIIAGGEEGDEMVGIMQTEEALMKAKDLDVDLVMISDKSDPPVCKIIDYGKYKFQQEKKKKEAKKKSKGQEVKEIKMSYKIENHDYTVRRKQVEKFILGGDRVKVLIQFRGREQQHFDIGHKLLNQINEDIQEIAVMESGIKKEGNRLICYFKPSTEKKK
jgi:translation initiation factor IF-3